MMGYMYVTYFMIERTGRGERQAATGWTGVRHRGAAGQGGSKTGREAVGQDWQQNSGTGQAVGQASEAEGQQGR